MTFKDEQVSPELPGFDRQFRKLVEDADQLFWVVSADFSRMLYISPSYERVWGRSVQSVIANPLSFLEAIHPDDRQIVAERQKERRVAKDPGVQTHEYRLVHPQGEIRWVRATSFPLFDSSGEVAAITGLVEDITDAKRIDDALRQSEAQLRMILENAPVMINSFTSDGRCLLWNDECERILGWARDEIARHPDPLSLVYPDPAEYKRVIEIVAHPDGQFREFVVRAKDGSDLIQAWADFMLPDGATIGVGYDLTAGKESERALRESEAKYRLLFESAGAPVMFLDREGTFLLLNNEAAANIGGTPEEMIGRSVNDLFPPEAAAVYAARMDSVFTTGEGQQHEDEVTLPGGEIRWYGSTLQPVHNVSGRIVGVQVVSHDITDRKAGEQRQAKVEEQMRALAMRLQTIREDESTKISREIHDELGQKLTALKMDLAWVQRRVARANSAETRGAVVEKIAAMYDEIDETIGSIRRISTRLRPGILDDLGLTGAIEWAAQQFEKRTNVRCRLEIESSDVQPDPYCSTAMFRIFQEILTNVTRHAQANHVMVKIGYANGFIAMTVDDDGRGIKAENLEAGGLGILGMRERANSFGGTLSIGPRDDRGTRVQVQLPVRIAGEDGES